MTVRLEPMLRHIRRLASGSQDKPESDAALLERFTRQRDESAFATLIARHGAMVLGVCRRVLHDHQDAEDAFQATFLALARKADPLRHPDRLAAWLHVTARQLALKSRRDALRRRQRERSCPPIDAAASVDPLDELSAREMLQVLDEEIQRLPEVYRLPLVLCCLEGRTQEEAARLLGWTPGSVRGRLERGRARLHARLLRRGLTLPATLLAVESSRGAAMTPPSESARSILQAALCLAESGTRHLSALPLKLVLTLTLAAGVIAVAASAMTRRQATPMPPSTAADSPKPREDKQARTDRYGDPLPPGALVRLGTVRLRHQGQSFAFAPDGKRIASTDSDGFVRIWDAATGQQRRRLEGFYYPRQVAYSPDGKLLAVKDFEDRTVVHVWDMTTGKRVHKLSGGKLEQPIKLSGLAFSPDGKLLAVGECDAGITLWNVASGERVGRLDKCKGEHCAIAFLSDGKRLLVASREGVVGVWDTHGRQLRKFEIKLSNRADVAVTPDGKTLVLGDTREVLARGEREKSIAGQISIWDLTTGKERRRLETPDCLAGLALSPDGKTLAYVQDGASVIQLRDTDSWKEGRRLDVPEGSACNLTFSPDGKTLAARVEHALQLWDVATGRPPADRPGHTAAVGRVAFTANGRQLVSISPNQKFGTARLWDALTGQYLAMLPDNWSWTDGGVLCPSRDGTTLLVGDFNDIAVWDVRTRRTVRRISIGKKSAPTATHQILALALSPNGTRLTSISEDGNGRMTFLVSEVSSGAEVHRREVVLTDRRISPLALSPDGRLAATTDGRAVWVRDVVSGAIRQTLHIAKPEGGETLWGRLTFSNDGRLLACISRADSSLVEDAASTSGKVRIWEVTTGAELPPLAAPWMQAIAFAPDGWTLATAGGAVNDVGFAKKPIRLWDIATGKEVARFEGHGTLVGSWIGVANGGSLAFSPDGQRLATGLMDSTVLLWDVKPVLQRVRKASPSVREEDLRQLWADLAGEDVRKAQASLRAMAAVPNIALPFLEQRLSPARAADPEQLRRLIADLDSEQFAVRKAASEELRKLDLLAEPALRKALEGKPSLEGRRRIEELLAIYRGPAVSDEARRTVRAVVVLEYMKNEGASRLLKKLTAGAPEARLTRETTAALERVRPPSP